MASFAYPGEHIYDGMVLHDLISVDNIRAIKDFQTHPTDICIASYPKCGTTWMSNILRLLYHGNCDRNLPLRSTVNYVEFDGTKSKDPLHQLFGNGLEALKSRQSPRLMFTHLPASYWRDKVEQNRLKVIMVVRHVKDQMVSYYHHHKYSPTMSISDLTMEMLFHRFVEKSLCHGDFFAFFEGWYNLRDRPNVLLVRYEDLKEDLVKEISKISKFCGRNNIESRIIDIAQKCEFSAMQKDPTANLYEGNVLVRKGIVGGWPKYLTREQSQYLDDVIGSYPDYCDLYHDL